MPRFILANVNLTEFSEDRAETIFWRILGNVIHSFLVEIMDESPTRDTVDCWTGYVLAAEMEV